MRCYSLSTQLRTVAALVVLLYANAAQAQLTAGGDAAGGYWHCDAKTLNDKMKHGEGKASLWLGYKATDHDWRLTVAGSYMNVDGEKQTEDFFAVGTDSASTTLTQYTTNEKPLNLSARYDFNWRQKDKGSYSLWTKYDYDNVKYDGTCMGTAVSAYAINNVFGRFEVKRDVEHKIAAGYHGSTRLHDSRWVLQSDAGVSLSRKKVKDEWIKMLIDFGENSDESALDTKGWEMHPDYTDYALNAALHLTDTLRWQPSSRLVLGGGVRFSGEGERFTHDSEVSGFINFPIEVDTVFIDQRATGFRFFVEPFLSGEWLSDKWSLSAEYGLRLYHMSTTDNTGNAVRLYNFMEPQNALSGHRFTHFRLLASGRALLVYNISRHHRLSLTNSISNRLPSNSDAVLCFVQQRDHNKVSLGNPNLKPEVKIQFSIGHTFTSGPFSATTDISVERVNNATEQYFYGCSLGGRNETAQVTRNIADITSWRLSETITWNSKWLKASATLWGDRAHHQGIGRDFGESTIDYNNWGWRLDARASLGHGWLLTTDFQYMGKYKSLTYVYDRTWPSSAASLEKRFGNITVYLSANSLVNPTIRYSRYDTKGNKVYYKESLSSDRIVLLGCRWLL